MTKISIERRKYFRHSGPFFAPKFSLFGPRHPGFLVAAISTFWSPILAIFGLVFGSFLVPILVHFWYRFWTIFCRFLDTFLDPEICRLRVVTASQFFSQFPKNKKRRRRRNDLENFPRPKIADRKMPHNPTLGKPCLFRTHADSETGYGN